MAAFALLTASGRSLYPNTTRSSSSCSSTHHPLQQDDQHEYEDRRQIEGYSTDAQGGKESPDRSEDRFCQVIQDTVQDSQTRTSPAARQREQQVKDDPPKQDEPVDRQQQRKYEQYSRHRPGLVEEAPLLEPASLLGRDLDVSGGQQEHLLRHALDAPVQPKRETGGEVDQALRRLGLHGLQVHDHGDVGLELLADLLGVVEARGLDEVDLPGGNRRNLMDHRLHRLVEVPVAATDVPVVVTADTPDRYRAADGPARLRHVDQLLLLVRRLDQPQPDQALLERPGDAPHLPSYASSSYVLRRGAAYSPCPPRGDRTWAGSRRAPSEEQRCVHLADRLSRSHDCTSINGLPSPLVVSATKARSSCSTGSPLDGALWRPWAENRRADAHQGGALLHGGLEVGGHAHRQRPHARLELPAQLGQAPEDRAQVLGRGRRGGHEHQAGQLEPLYRPAGRDELVETAGGDAVGGLALVQLDLHQGVGHGAGVQCPPAERPGAGQGVQRVDERAGGTSTGALLRCR